MDTKWLSRSHRSVNVKHNAPKAVSLSKCHFHFGMCSAISAAATHSVPAAQGRSGPGHSLWVQRFGAAPEPSLHREAEQVPRAPSTIPISSCAMGTQAQQWKDVCNYWDPKLPLWPGTPQWEHCKTPRRNSSCILTLLLLHHPLHKPLSPMEVSTLRSSAVWPHTQAWALQFNPDYPPHTGTNTALGIPSNRNRILKEQTSRRPRTQQAPTAPPWKDAEMPQRVQAAGISTHSLPEVPWHSLRGLLSLAFISTSQLV